MEREFDKIYVHFDFLFPLSGETQYCPTLSSLDQLEDQEWFGIHWL